MQDEIFITKANGEREIFDVTKLESSLRRAGANENIIKEVVDEVTKVLFDGVSTSEIYHKAFEVLREKEKMSATRYSVRRAVMDMGPYGFPFEDFVGEIFRTKGYKVEVGKTVSGACVLHELDVFAYNEDEVVGVEAKFHNNSGVKSDLKTALYVKARFDDLQKGDYYKKMIEGKVHKRMIFTNTKFTTRAIQYGNCVGLYLVGWSYPEKGNLNDLIDETGLHPITSLQSLTSKQKDSFLKQGIVLCRDLKEGGENLLVSFGIAKNKVNDVLVEINALCH